VQPVQNATHDDAALEGALGTVEARLAALGEALRERDVAAIDRHAGELHRALARAVDAFSRQAARGGVIAPVLRNRLAHAGGCVAAQRESLARATAALDRAIDVLMPQQGGGSTLYGAHGAAERPLRGGGFSA
jgi:hypothetical protein